MTTPSTAIDAATKDAVFEASIEFIGTLTGMTPPPIETAPAEVFKPFKDFTDRVCEIFGKSMAMKEREIDALADRVKQLGGNHE